MNRSDNIGPRGRRQRLLTGFISLAIATIIAISLIAAGVPRGWRLLVFPLLWAGWLGVFQAKEKT